VSISAPESASWETVSEAYRPGTTTIVWHISGAVAGQRSNAPASVLASM
jgi:hypothetical protein